MKVTRNFERVLGESRQAANIGASQQRQFERLQVAVLDAFGEMNMALSNQRFEFYVRGPEHWVVTFLSEFDAIFTLNQDLLLELHYAPGKTVEQRRRWHASVYPGIDLPEDWFES